MKRPTTSQLFTLLANLFAMTAFVLMWIGSLNCNFIKFTDTSGTSEPITLEFGIWYYRHWSHVYTISGNILHESCREYPSWIEFDSSWKAARAFSVMAFFLSVSLLIAVCLSACAINSQHQHTWHGWESPSYLLLAFFQGSTFSLLNSKLCHGNFLIQILDGIMGESVTFPEKCSMGTGAKLIISSTVFFFDAALSSFVAYKAERKECDVEEQDDLQESLTA